MEDSTSMFGMPVLNPQDAAENINATRDLKDMTPTQYGAIKGQLKAQRELAQTTPTLSDLMNTDDNYKKIAKPDIDKLGMVEKQALYAATVIRGNDLNRDTSNILQKEFRGETLTQDDINNIDINNAKMNELTTEKDFDYNFFESLPAYAIGSTVDWAKGLWEEKETALKVFGYSTTIGMMGGPTGFAQGAKTGLVAGPLYAGFKDSWENTRGILLNEMNRSDMDLPKERKIRIANGAGLVVGLLDAVGESITASTVPWIGKRVTPKVILEKLLQPDNKQWLTLAERVGISALGEGGTEGIQEYVDIFAKELAKTFNGTDTNLISALEKTVLSVENLKQAAKAAATGAVIGPVVGETLGGVGKIFERKEKPEDTIVSTEPDAQTEEEVSKAPPETQLSFRDPEIQRVYAERTSPEGLKELDRGVKAIQVGQLIVNTIARTYDTQMKNLIPKDLEDFRQKILAQAGLPYVVLDADKVKEWATDDKKAEAVRNILDKAAIANSQMGADYRVEAGKYTSLVEEFGESALHLFKMDEGDKTVDEYTAMFKAEKTKHDDLIKELTSPNGDLFAWSAKHSLKEPTVAEGGAPAQQPTKVADSEQAYINQPDISEKMEGAFTETEAAGFNKALREARTEISQNLRADAEVEADRVRDVVESIITEVEREDQLDKIDSDPKIALVESFANDKPRIPIFNAEEVRAKHKSKKSPLMAINPDSLTAEQKSRFSDDMVLKERRVFDKGGLSVREVAENFGVTPDELLETLSSTPDRKKALENAIEAKAELIKEEARASVDINQSLLFKAYDKASGVYEKTMKLLAARNYSKFALGAKKVARIMTTADARVQAEALVRELPVNQLQVKGYKIAEAKANQRALDAYFKGDFEAVIKHKEQAMLNLEMQRAISKAIANTNKTSKKIGRALGKAARTTVKEAGPKFLNPYIELVTAFNLDPARKTSTIIGAYEKFIKMLQEEGVPGQTLDADVKLWLEGKISVKNLTVDQYLNLGNKLNGIVHQARMINKLIEEAATEIEGITNDEIVENLVADATQHVDYDPAKAVNPQTGLTADQQTSSKLSNWSSYLTNVEYILIELGMGNIADNKWIKTFMDPLKGSGAFANSRNGQAAANKLLDSITKRYDELVKAYGKSEYKNWNVDLRNIRAFARIPSLNNGRITKAELIMLALNFGNEYNRSKVANFGIEPDIVFEVLKKQLGKKDWDFVQGVWDIYNDLGPRVKEVHKVLTGEDLEMVTATPFTLTTATGDTLEFKGGYFPAKYRTDANAENSAKKAERELDIADGKTPDYIPDIAGEGIVKFSASKERIGSNWELSLNFDNISTSLEDVVYATTMSIPVRDVSKLLQDPRLANAIISVVGKAKYNILVENVKESTKSVYAETTKIFGEQNRAVGAHVKSVQSTLAVTYIAYKTSSLLMQLTSLTNVLMKLGPQGVPYLSGAAARIVRAMRHGGIDEIYKFAASIDPSIETARLNVDSNAQSKLRRMSLQKRKRYSKSWNAVLHFRDAVSNFAFDSLMGNIEIFQKVVTVIAARNQYLAGDVPGGPTLRELSKRTEQERHDAANSFAASVSRTALTVGTPLDQSFVQKTAYIKMFAQFYNDARNTLNTNIQEGRNIKYNIKKSKKYIKEGKLEKASLEVMDAGGRSLKIAVLTAAAFAYQSLNRGESALGDEEDEDPEKTLLKFTAKVAANATVDQIPGLREISFVVQNALASDKGVVREVSTPILRAMTDSAKTLINGVTIANDLIEGIDLETSLQQFDQNDAKSALSTTSVFLKGIPVNAAFELMKFFENRETGNEPPLSVNMLATPVMVAGALDNILETMNENREQLTLEQQYEADIEEVKRREEGTSVTQKLEQLKEQAEGSTEKKIPQVLSPDEVNEFKEIIKQHESGGIWNNRPYKTKILPDGRKVKTDEVLSQAFGLYQFLPDTWKNIMRLAPELGLTVEGRTSKDTSQQEKAMEWLLQESAGILKKKNIPLTVYTLYSAHYVGPEPTSIIYSPKFSKYDKTQLSKILRPRDLEANPWLKELNVKQYKMFVIEKMDNAAKVVGDNKRMNVSKNDRQQ